MDRLALTKELKTAGVSDSAISFSLRNDKYCILEINGRWLVTFTERGVETYRAEFGSENEVCRHVFGLLTHANT